MNRRIASLSLILLGIGLGASGQDARPGGSPLEFLSARELRPIAAPANPARSSEEQGRTSLTDSFHGAALAEERRRLFGDTRFELNERTMYFDRERFDGSVSRALATGGWIGARTGYLFEQLSFGVTGYTSQRIEGAPDEDGTFMLEPGQAGYTVLGEAYGELHVGEDVVVTAGRKEFNTPFANGNDSRMTPNTFELLVLQGLSELGPGDATLKYGFGWLDTIKPRNSDEFVSMGLESGAPVERGVLAAGALYQKGAFSIGAIDYHCADVINIGYGESKLELPFQLPLADNAVPRIAAQVVDQRSVGEDLLTGGSFAAQQFGFKGELPVDQALLTATYTVAGGGADLRSPWSGYPGYTSVQGEDFNRAGEGALLLRAAYEFKNIDGLSAYALWVNGGTPDDPGQYRRDEVDLNVQWDPQEHHLKGLSLRFRYAVVDEHGPTDRRLHDLRVIGNYTVEF